MTAVSESVTRSPIELSGGDLKMTIIVYNHVLYFLKAVASRIPNSILRLDDHH